MVSHNWQRYPDDPNEFKGVPPIVYFVLFMIALFFLVRLANSVIPAPLP